MENTEQRATHIPRTTQSGTGGWAAGKRTVGPRRLGVLWGALATLALSVLPGTGHAVEEPAYTVDRTVPPAPGGPAANVELRTYGTYAVAEVQVPGPADEAGSQAFPILAGYIFGKNKGERKLAMTAPVTQSAAPVTLAMTAPVTQAATPEGFLVQFVLPAGVTAANAPEPLDARVTLRDVAPKRIAAIRYSGFWSEANYAEHLALLQATLRAASIAWTGDPVLSRYNGPMTPWFLRRNEVWLALAP